VLNAEGPFRRGSSVGFVPSSPCAGPSTAASWHHRRSDSATCARPSHRLVVSSCLEPAAFRYAQACAADHVSPSPLAAPASRDLPALARARHSLLLLPGETALPARFLQDPRLAFRLAPSSSTSARFLSFPLSLSGLSADTGAPSGFPSSASGALARPPALAFWLTRADSSSGFRLPSRRGPDAAVCSKELPAISAPCTTTLVLAVSFPPTHVGRWEKRAFPASSPFFRAAAPLSFPEPASALHSCELTHLFELSDSSDSPGPFTGFLWV